MLPFETAGVFTKTGFCISFLANFILIYLTIFHVKQIFITYKRMVVYFAVVGILFSGLEVVARPFAHNFKGVFTAYGLVVSEVPKFIMAPYDSDGRIKIESLQNITVDLFLVCSHYLVILYCGIKMHFNMKKELKKFSAPQRKLQRQFFKALVIQSLGPTIFLVLPASPVLLTPVIAPLLNVQVHWKTGWMFSLIGLYPPFDSIAFMIIVAEYKKVIKKNLEMSTRKHRDQKSGDFLRKRTGHDTLTVNEAYRENQGNVSKALKSLGHETTASYGVHSTTHLRPSHHENAHFLEMSKLHEKLKTANSSTEVQKIEVEMYEKGKKFNESRSPPNRYDLHYLTVNVAVRYALEVVEKEKKEKKEKKHKEILLVTGNGNRSVDGIAAIKNAVLRDLGWLGYCTAKKDPRNPGVVLVKFK
ncbi:hypothetical protein CRE_02557 [Caenorhabditis remanei]|uniref:Smr domain-containing protein n=1 Tax=Caenorhabditis remanei TaxID=31234 RepID=E3MWW8_CAERE|nr:hypothetical protein CRE_02557 [Caenorhabditis remanei]